MYILHLHNIRCKYSEVLVTDNIDKFKPFPIRKGLSFYHTNKRGVPDHSYIMISSVVQITKANSVLAIQ